MADTGMSAIRRRAQLRKMSELDTNHADPAHPIRGLWSLRGGRVGTVAHARRIPLPCFAGRDRISCQDTQREQHLDTIRRAPARAEPSRDLAGSAPTERGRRAGDGERARARASEVEELLRARAELALDPGRRHRRQPRLRPPAAGGAAPHARSRARRHARPSPPRRGRPRHRRPRRPGRRPGRPPRARTTRPCATRWPSSGSRSCEVSSGTASERRPVTVAMTSRIEQYALIGDTQTAALVGRRRLDRLAVRPPLRLRRVLRRAARRRPHGRWLHRARGRRARRPAGATATARSCSRPSSTRPRARCASSTACRCATSDVDLVRIVEGVARRGADAHGAHRALRLRLVVPWVRRRSTAICDRSPGPTRCASRTPVRLEGARLAPRSPSSSSRRASGCRSCSPGTRRTSRAADADRRRAALSTAPTAWWQRLVERGRTYDGEWPRRGAALARSR